MLSFQMVSSFSIAFAFIIYLALVGNNIHVNINNNNYKANSDYFLAPLELTAFAQIVINNKMQQWIDKENNAKIIFTYDPESPVIGKPTKLLFGIQDLRTGKR
jgi:hypothetical protein